MSYENLDVVASFDENSLPDLDIITMATLELFSKEGLPKIRIPEFNRPIVAGSGNAKVSARILFSQKDALFADESNYVQISNRKGVDGAVVFSASGGKHAPLQVSAFLGKGLDTYLVTCNNKSEASKLLNSSHVIVTPKNREPYTYNTSTYMGWIFALTCENPKDILKFIEEKVKSKIPKNLGDYFGFLLVTPNEFEEVNYLFDTKFIELFGRRISRDVKTYEELKHAITVVPYEKELCIKFGFGEEIIFDGDILEIPLPKDCSYGAMMAIGYYVIGHIQKQHYPYFKENIKNYCKKASKKVFGKGIEVIIE